MIKMRHGVMLAALTALVLLVILMSGAGLQASAIPGGGPSVIGTIGLGVGSASLGPEGVAVDPTRNHIFVANSLNNTVYVIDGDTNQFTTITSGSLVTPWGAGFNPNNDSVYVASNGRNSVAVIDAATLQVKQEIFDSSLALPDQVLVDTLRNVIYVSNSSGGMITVINGQNNTVLTRFSSNLTAPHAMAIDPALNRLYVSNLFYIPGSGDYFSVFSTVSYTEIARRSALAGPNGLAVRTVDGSIYVNQSYSDNGVYRVGVVNASDLSFKVGFPGLVIGGRKPLGALYVPESDRVFINDYDSATVDVIDASDNTLIATLPVGANPASGLAANPTTGRVYVANRGSGSVSVIQDRQAEPTATPTVTVTPTATPTPICFADTYEPDNTPADANIINTAALPQNHNLCPGADQDWTQINVLAPIDLTMRTSGLTGGADTVMYLYAPDGTTLLAFNDDAGVGNGAPVIAINPDKAKLAGDELSSLITYHFPKAGQYKMMIKDFTPNAFGTERRYKVAVSGGPGFNNGLFMPVIISDF